jgi:hypothetical protein
MGIKLTNNAFGTLAAGISSSATSITLTSGQGARFPTLSAGDYFYATLIDTSNNLEIVKCTARSTDVLTVTRAQESTTARAYSTGDRIEIRLTAQTFLDAAISDGDKGDITVSSTGTVWTIDNAVVTAAKMAAGAASGNLGYTPVNPSSLAAIATSGSASDLSAGTLPKARTWSGGLINFAQTVSTTVATRTSSAWGEVNSGYRINYTPVRSDSTLLVMFSFGYSIDTDHYTQTFRMYDFTNSATMSIGGVDGSRNRATGAHRGQYNVDNAIHMVLHSIVGSGSTTARAYGFQHMGAGTVRINSSYVDRSDPWGWTTPFVATVMEFAP